MTVGTVLEVADEMWVAAALLQRERGAEGDFTPAEVEKRAQQESLSPERRPGVLLHAQYHAVAARPPKRGAYRMLAETTKGRRRLFRPGDPYHPDREGAKMHPERGLLPDRYQPLLEWYLVEYAQLENGGLLCLVDELREWADRTGAFRGVNADEYVQRLRQGWDE